MKPEFIQLKAGTEGYKTDWNNIAPSASVAWRPNVQDGFLRTLLGNPEQATLRAGWSVAYERQGLSEFTGIYGPNPGSTLSLTRDTDTGLVPPGESWPVLFSQKNRLYQQPFPESPTFPIPVRENRADSINAFAPDIQVGRAQTWMIGFQRSITSNMAMEIRYVGTNGSNQWSALDWNGIRGENIVANKFIDEFRLAMANLAANNASGVVEPRGVVRLLRAGHGHEPAADLPRLLQRQPGRRQPGGLHRRAPPPGRARPSPTGCRRRPRRRSPRRATWTATPRGGRTRWRPATRRTSSSSTPT